MRLDHVSAPDLGRFDPERAGRLVHEALHHEHDLRPAHAAIGRGWGLVRRDGARPRPVPAHLVDPRQLTGRHQGLDRRREREDGVRADVAADVGVQGQETTGVVEAGAHVVLLLAGVEGGEEVLPAVLHPGHWSAQPPCQGRDRHLLAAHHALQAEASADVGGDDANPLLGQAEGSCDAGAHLVRHLGGHVDDELVVAVDPLGEAGPALHRRGGEPAAAKGLLQPEGAAGEHGVQVGVVADPHIDEQVADRLLVHLRGPRSEGGADRRGGRQVVVVHVHRLRAVLRQVGVGGDHDRDGLADEADPSRRKHRHGGHGEVRPVEHGPQRVQAQVVGGEHRHHPGDRPSRRDVDAEHPGAGHRAAHEGRVQLARQGEVTDETTSAGDEPPVLPAWQCRTDPGALGGQRGLTHRRVLDPASTPRAARARAACGPAACGTPRCRAGPRRGRSPRRPPARPPRTRPRPSAHP